MPKWKELPTDPATLRQLYEKLKDKEMKLEADLAMKEYPDVEESITRVALALAEVKKLDERIQKAAKPTDMAERRELEALVNRMNYLRRQLEIVEEQVKARGGRDMEKLVEMKIDRDRAFAQLRDVYTHSKGVFEEHDLDLSVVVPSIADFIAVGHPQN